MKKFLIIFLGIDGAGKTTLTNEISVIIKEKYKIKLKYVWFRSIIQIYLSERFFNRKRLDQKHGSTKTFRNKFDILYRNLILLDYFTIMVLLIKIPMFFGYNIICDRYIYDIILDLASDFNYSRETTEKLINLKLFPKPDIVYFINIPANIAKERRPEHTLAELNYKIETLNQFKNHNLSSKIIDVDGSKNLPILINEIEKSLIEHGIVKLNE